MEYEYTHVVLHTLRDQAGKKKLNGERETDFTSMLEGRPAIRSRSRFLVGGLHLLSSARGGITSAAV